MCTYLTHQPPIQAPVINIVRDPRWGRNIECAGEDPFLSGEYAVHWVRGFQEAKEAPYPLQAAACCKHFVANELEAWNGTDRHHVDSKVPQQDLVDRCAPPAPLCVRVPPPLTHHVTSSHNPIAQLPPLIPSLRRAGPRCRCHVLV